MEFVNFFVTMTDGRTDKGYLRWELLSSKNMLILQARHSRSHSLYMVITLQRNRSTFSDRHIAPHTSL